MNRVTVCLAYYENPSMLSLQCETFRAYPDDLKSELSLIVVDDGSPTYPAKHEDIGFPFELYRIGVDVRWNQDACRNIAAHHAGKGWLILTDMDHLIPADTMRYVLTVKHDKAYAYRFARVDYPAMLPKMKDGKPHPHPNSYLMHSSLYSRVGGYDEFFAGHYGTDGDFAHRLREASGDILSILCPLARVPRDIVADASTTTYGRKEQIDLQLGRLRAVREAERKADPVHWRPLTLSFPYLRVA
jgi:hypothetical protein